MGFCIDGYVSDMAAPELGSRLGDFGELGQVLQEHDIDELVIALDTYQETLLKKLIYTANKEGVRVSIIPTYNRFIPPNPSINAIGDTSLIDLSACPLDNIVMAMVKRLMDIAGSVLAILLLSPVMLATAIGVKLSSPGPVFFVQERVGRNRKIFKMLKFRSMCVLLIPRHPTRLLFFPVFEFSPGASCNAPVFSADFVIIATMRQMNHRGLTR